MEQLLSTGDDLTWKCDDVPGDGATESTCSEAGHSSDSDSDDSDGEPVELCDAEFDGAWSKAFISRGNLTWNEGVDVPITILSSKRFWMYWSGECHTGEVRDDGKLYWDDSDVWIRPTAEFDGVWDNARIDSGVLTWNEGEQVPIVITGSKTFKMTYVRQVYFAVLLDNGELHWDDSDVWTRPKAEFDGVWANARINKGILKWNEGETVPIIVTGSKTFSMTYVGQTYCAELRDDGRLHWNDSDVWARTRQLPPWMQKGRHCERSKRTTQAAAVQPTVAPAASAPPAKNTPPLKRGMPEKRGHDVACKPQTPPAGEAVVPKKHARRGSGVIVSEPQSEMWYEGIISWFRGTYGWIECAALKARYPAIQPDRHIFLHWNDISWKDCDAHFRPQQHGKMAFQLAPGTNGNPKAVNVRPAGKLIRAQPDPECRINARDFFSAQRTC